MSRRNDVDGPISKRSQPSYSQLIPRSTLRDALEDDDDIEWPEDPFDRPDSADPKSPDELLAMIQFEGTSAPGCIEDPIH